MSSSLNKKDALKFGNTFCPLLFMHCHIDMKKETKVCCHSEEKIGNTLDFNSQEYKILRNNILNGEKINNCQVCYDLENIKQTSFRQKTIINLKEYNDLIDEQINRHKNNQELKPYWYDLRISNNCNLECIMCNHEASSSIAKSMGINNSHLSNEIDIDINPQSIKIYLAGGEPFLIKKFTELLSKIENSDCEIIINTNATTITRSMVNVLKKFNNVSLTVSLEGYGELNEKIRKNSKWEIIDKNIDKFIKLGYYLHVTTVLQKDNINNLYELGTYIESKNIKYWTIDEVQFNEELDWRYQKIDKESINKLLTLKIVKNNIHSMALLQNVLKHAKES